jgi:phosphohistidine phosphatase
VGTGRTLYVLRHAKSDWSDPALADRERPLADKGRRQVGRLVKHAASLPVEMVVSSPAVRARQTVDPVRDVIGCELREDSRLYSGSEVELLQVVRELPDGCSSAMVVGHMPGLATLVEALTGDFLDFPTGGLATVTLPGPWSAAGESAGRLAELVSPRDLRERQAAEAPKEAKEANESSRRARKKAKRRRKSTGGG